MDIDEITSCLKEVATGEIYETEVIRIKRKSFLSKYNSRTGWHVNWAKFDSNVEIYALVLKGTVDIQGLIAIIDDKEADAVHIEWACASPENDFYFQEKKRFIGVGAHLYAIASEKSVEYGHDGFIHAETINDELLVKLCNKYNATHMPLPNKPTHFFYG